MSGYEDIASQRLKQYIGYKMQTVGLLGVAGMIANQAVGKADGIIQNEQNMRALKDTIKSEKEDIKEGDHTNMAADHVADQGANQDHGGFFDWLFDN